MKTGTIRRWDATRGFGFIRSPHSADIFFHVRDFRGAAGALPSEGLEVCFEEIHVGGKGPRAMAVRPANAPVARATPLNFDAARRVARPSTRPSGQRSERCSKLAGQRWMLGLMPLWAGMFAYGIVLQRLPVWTAATVLAINVLALFFYAFDKGAAERGSWRTKEDTLHLLSLAGGWPAAWLARNALRHKSNKPSFQTAETVTVLLHCTAMSAWIFWPLIRGEIA